MRKLSPEYVALFLVTYFSNIISFIFPYCISWLGFKVFFYLTDNESMSSILDTIYWKGFCITVFGLSAIFAFFLRNGRWEKIEIDLENQEDA